MSHPTPLNANQVKSRLRQKGITITQWAKDRGYPRNEVYRVLNGQAKGFFGQAHEIAVALGMKASDAQPTTPGNGRNTQDRQAA